MNAQVSVIRTMSLQKLPYQATISLIIHRPFYQFLLQEIIGPKLSVGTVKKHSFNKQFSNF